MASTENAPVKTAISMTLDCADAVAQARFWARALGYQEYPPPVGWDTWDAFLTDQDVPPDESNDGAAIDDPAGMRPSISFLKVPEPKRAKNRLHLDLQVSGGRHVNADERTQRIDTKVVELVAAGATVHERYVVRGQLDHLVMLDPEGNEFCVV